MTTSKKQIKNELKFGKITLKKTTSPSQYIPKNSTKFIDHQDILKTLAIGIQDNLPVLMIGESGTGKTASIRYLASELNHGLRRVNLNGGTTADELVGRLLLNDKGTYWVDGVLTEAMRTGDWIVLDEINAALPEVLFVLQSVLDDDGFLVLSEKEDKEIVHKHPDFRLFATCNPPEYAGTKEMNKALLSRFGICISTDYPVESIEKKIIQEHLGDKIAKSTLVEKLIGMAKETRKSKESGNSEDAINTRDILHVLKLSKCLEPMDAIAYAFANKLNSFESKAMKSLGRLHLPTATKTTGKIKTAVQSIENLIIGGNYTFEEDCKEALLSLQKEEDFNKTTENDLGEIISTQTKSDAIKNDGFTICGCYFEEEDTISITEKADKGAKVASIIKFTQGKNKNKKAIILHHEDLEDSLEIIKSIYAIS